MSSFEGLTHLTDHQHHRFGVFNAMNRRSDSIESHGSISSLSSTHSSVNGGNGGNSGGTPLVELSRYRRVEPPRSLNTGCAARNSGHACHALPRDAKIKSSRPSMMLLHSTSMMETPGRQQTLNRSRSGSCPVVWEVNNSVREHPVDSPKWRQLPSGFAASPSSYGPRPDERSPYGQRTGSVQYAASQNDCRFLGGVTASQGGSEVLSPNWDAGGPNYERRRMFERCPTENCLSDLARSPNVVSSLQRSLSTMSMGVVPNSSFTSKLNCNLSKSYTNKLNSLSRNGREHINESKKDMRTGRPNAFQTKLPSSMEMGINYNPPKSGHVKRQREVFEKDSTRKESSFSPKITPFENRRHFKYRSFENISSASSQLSAVTPNENRSNGELNCLTPVENRYGRRQPGLRLMADKCDDLSAGCTPMDGKHYNKLLASAHDGSSKFGSVANVHKSNELARDSYANSVNSDDGELDNTPDTPSPDKNWSWSPLKPLSNSQNGKKVGGSLTSLRSITAAAISDNDLEPKSPERYLEVALTPRNEEKSKYVSEMFVSIAKPRPASGSAKDFPTNPGAFVRRPLMSSLSSYDLPSNLNPKHSLISRSSLPLAVNAADKTHRNERFPSANNAASARNRRHSNPMEKTSENSPDVRLHIANQKEAFTGLLKGINDVYQYRENLRIHVAQLENEMQERRSTANQRIPSVYELEKLYESNSQLKLKVQQLSREFELAKSKTSKRNANDDDVGGAWSCSACTFINHPALNLCECCELPRLSFVMR